MLCLPDVLSLKGGNLEEIILECKSIQGHLKLMKNNQNYMKTFAKLKMQGKVNAALRFLSDQQGSGVLQLTESVLIGLEEKHPAPAQINFCMVPFVIMRTLIRRGGSSQKSDLCSQARRIRFGHDLGVVCS